MASKISASRKEAGSKLPADKKVVINKQTDASKDPVSKMQPVPEKGEDIGQSCWNCHRPSTHEI